MQFASNIRLTLRYQIAHRDTLAANPASDMVLTMASGELSRRVAVGETTWFGGPACQILGFEASGTAADLPGLAGLLAAQAARANELLGPLGGRLMPGGAHPFMDPTRETWIWNHDQAQAFAAMDRIFGLKSQAWSNQAQASLELSCPGEDEFVRVLAALRLLAPLVPALAAGSPLVDAADKGFHCERLLAFAGRGGNVPGLGSGLIPEPAASSAGFRDAQCRPLKEALAELDPEGLLAPEDVVLGGLRPGADPLCLVLELADVQECPAADLAVAARLLGAMELLAVRDDITDDQLPAGQLDAVLLDCARQGEDAQVTDAAYLARLGLGHAPLRAGDAWRALGQDQVLAPELVRAADVLDAATLSGRLRRELGTTPSPEAVRRVYTCLCDCLASGEMFA
jgi:glutamate---cysteine ligase / carboxylate-amine ligase